MPIIWRFLLGQYFKILILSVFSFIAILLVLKMEETARVAALGAPWKEVGLFILYQIPYILPIALPLSCLISALLLTQRLSSSHELTAMRASGLSLFKIILPILLSSILLSLANFFLISEIATKSHLSSRQMVRQLTALNPLLILNQHQQFKFKDFSISAKSSTGGVSASDVVAAAYQKASKRIALFIAKELDLTESMLIHGKQVALISSSPFENQEFYDHLFIDQQDELFTGTSELTQMLKQTQWQIQNDYLQMSLLLARKEQYCNELKSGPQENSLSFSKKAIWQKITRCNNEIVRRFSFGMAPLSFTLLGCAFGLKISRNRSKKGILIVVLLTAASLISFFLAKSIDHTLWLPPLLYSLPHALIICCAIFALKRISRGKE